MTAWVSGVGCMTRQIVADMGYALRLFVVLFKES